MTVLELLDVPLGTSTVEGPLTPYRRFALESEFAVGEVGTVRVPGLQPGTGWRLVLERGTPRFVGEPGARLRSLTDSIFEATMGTSRIRFRVVADETPSLAWPVELDALVARVTPGNAGLDVLADVLLERRHPLGERLRGLPTGFSDDLWQGDLPLLEAEGSIDLRWSRGMVTDAIVRSQDGCERVAAQLLSHLAQSVELVLWEDATNEAAHAVVDRLAARGLPWLSRLTVHGAGNVGRELERTWKKGRWRSRFPDTCVLDVPADRTFVLRAGSSSTPIPPQTTVPVGGSSPPSFVRRRGAVPVLTVNQDHLMLNGIARRRPSPLRPWLIPLRPRDVFTLDDLEVHLETK